jgi:hypothetical protein
MNLINTVIQFVAFLLVFSMIYFCLASNVLRNYFPGLQLRVLAPQHVARHLKEALPSKWFSSSPKTTVNW